MGKLVKGKGLLLDDTPEAGMSLPKRQWDRHIERIGECKEGWNALWLAAAAAAGGAAVTAATTAIALRGTPTDLQDSHLSDQAFQLLIVIAIASTLLAVVCFVSYVQRKAGLDKAIDQVVKDMKVHEPPD